MSHSRLLIQEHPIQVLPQLAKEIGLNEAIILQQIHYWIDPHKQTGTTHHGRKWIYNTYQQWHEQFPFWSVDTIKRAILRMEEQGIIDATDDLNPNPRDRTKWYTINYDHPILSGAKCPTLEQGKMPHSEEGKMPPSTYAETTTETTQETTAPTRSTSAKARFDEWYATYPRKVGKQAALQSFMRHATNVPVEVLIAAVERQKKSDQWTKNGGQFIPNPSTWLNQGRWDDELPSSNGQNNLPANMQVNNERDLTDEQWLGSFFKKGGRSDHPSS